MNLRKLSAEAILSVIIAPAVIWFITFVFTSYETRAEIEDQKKDIQEIKEDVKYIRNYLMERQNGK